MTSREAGLPAQRGRRIAAATIAAAAALVVLVGCGPPPPVVSGCDAEGPLTPLCGFSNPEDLAALPGSDWLVVSQFPQLGNEGGSLIAYRPSSGERRPLYPEGGSDAPRPGAGDPDCTTPPDRERFAPHGIDLTPDAASLLVVNHGGREVVERFAVLLDDEGAPSLAWEGCAVLPDADMGNDVAAREDGSFVVTRMTPRNQGLALFQLLLGLDSGFLLSWSPEQGFVEVPGTTSKAPNGVAVAPDGRLFLAEWVGERVLGVAPDGERLGAAELDFHPDNLTWAPDGMLLAAGQRAPMQEIPACRQVKGGSCGLASVVVAIDPDTFEVTVLLDHDPARIIGAASVALATQGKIYIGTFSGDRIVVFEP